MGRDYYAILGVPRTATTEDIEAAWNKMMQLYGQETFAANISRTATEARDVLTDPEKRRAYDARLVLESAPPPPPLSPLPPSSPEDLHAFYSKRFRAESASVSNFSAWLFRPVVVMAMAVSVLLIDILVWLFGMRLAPGSAAGFFFRASVLTFLGWGGYLGLRYYTKNVFFTLAYSLFYGVTWGTLMVRLYFDPNLYAGRYALALGQQVGFHFIVFYLVFFCSAQLLEEGGLATLFSRAVGRK